ncbi:ketopantoate reductase family protein [Brevibacterium yomogidense]|uniref:ketopantoate reductase family protein n=1 Tax=Brevibacterium yomogidense TaxID=946573 RepID=UPI0018DF6333|nr:2-dehydropantoate 2-reductase [Brevibacterium yomogidense]
MATVAVVGMGAMGSVYAGLMQDAGHIVYGICLWDDHVAAIRERGLRVHGASGDRTVRLTAASATSAGIGPVDLVIIATKSFDVEQAARDARPLIGPRTVVQTIQNGLGSPDRVAGVIGAERLSIGVVGGFGASVPEPGTAHHNGMELIRFGSYGKLPFDEVERGAKIWRTAGFNVRLFEDVERMVWEKFIMNVTFSGTACLTGLTIGEVLEDEDAWLVARACGEEAIELAGVKGVPLDVGDPIEHIRRLGSAISAARPSMLIDALEKRRSEVDAINGAVVTAAKGTSVSTTVNATVSELIRAREKTYL